MDFNSDDPRIGTVLNGRYEIKEQLGAGGMALVYLAERVELGRPVAIKFLQEVMLRYPKFISRFQAEAKAMSKLSHPHCVSVIDFGVESAPYIVMDYVEGKTLKKLLKQGRFSVERAVFLTRQILAGIAHAHSFGIIHRDIKPDNIIVQEVTGIGEQVKIFDFGLAKLLDPAMGVSLSTGSMVAGTPNYMSPEQSRGETVDERTDVYSIGVMLFELLTGRKPFVSDDFLEVVRMHRETIPPALFEVAPDVTFPPELESIVSQALAKSPDERFQTAEEFTAALNEVMERDSVVAMNPAVGVAHAETLPIADGVKVPGEETVSVEKSVTKEKISRRWIGAALASAVAIIVLIIAMVGGESDSDESTSQTEDNNAVADKSAGDGTIQGKSSKVIVVPYPAPAKGKDEPVPDTKAAEEKSTADTSEKVTKTASDTAVSTATVVPPTDDETGEDVPPGAKEVKKLADVEALIESGQREAAIAGLHKLRRLNPKVAHYQLLLGNLYFQKDWWGDAMDHYREAIRLNPAYKRRAALNRNLVKALGNNKSYRKAVYIIQKSIGKAAIPYLKKGKKDTNPIVRKRSAAQLKKLRR